MSRMSGADIAEVQRRLDLFSAWKLHWDPSDRAQYHVLIQCADRARAHGDLDEAYRLYDYVARELQGLMYDVPDNLFGIIFSSAVPTLGRKTPLLGPPTDPGPWYLPQMSHLALQACGVRTLNQAPPDGPAKFLYMLMPVEKCEVVVGDLEEEFRRHVQPRFGATFARRWYWKQAIFTCLEHWLARPALAAARFAKEVLLEAIKRRMSDSGD